ncbi:MAG: hypothetical protein IJ026_01145 [Candidatus Methanomethylophilaceae archaeon]|nr:hypothetical protein [Candidatus Methanomethylophilaceae archaeon]
MDRYLVLSLSVMVVVSLFLCFPQGQSSDYDVSGIVYDVNPSSKGYTFYIETSDGTVFRCFHDSEPSELGYYGVVGDMSSDGGMFFVTDMFLLDNL